MGPLTGLRIVEFAGIGPGPMAAMLLSDMGATVLRVERPAPSGLGLEQPSNLTFLNRGRRSVAVDLKRPEGVALALALVEKSDALIEGFRPQTMERLGLGPDKCLARNKRLVFGRVTGWGQEGPLALSAGHDINYIALSGVLDAIGREGHSPTPPLNLIGDYAGAVYLCMGMLGAMLEAQRSGEGQVVDAAMVDAATSLMTSAYAMKASGMFGGGRGTNILDSGMPTYEVYACADGKFISIAPIETKFRKELFGLIGLGEEWVERATDRQHWPALRQELTTIFKSKTRAQWCELLENTDSCFAPVLSMAEAPEHHHQKERQGFIDIDGVQQPAPAPRFSRSKAPLPTPPEAPGESGDQALREWGFSEAEIATWQEQGAMVPQQRSS